MQCLILKLACFNLEVHAFNIKYDIVNNELTDALDAGHAAVEAWAKQEGMAMREKVAKEPERRLSP